MSFFNLGFGIYYLDGDEINTINFDVISERKQEAFTVVESFRLLRNQSFFKSIEKEKYIIWSDCGKSFLFLKLFY